MLDNRNKDGHFLKDFHFYNTEDNLWNSLARASSKTMDFFHREHLKWNGEMQKKKEAEKNSASNAEFQRSKRAFEDRRVIDSQTFKERKMERLVLQEKAGQPIDHRFERDIDEKIFMLQADDAEKIVLKRSAVKKTLSATGGAPNVWNDHSQLTQKQTKLIYPPKVIEKDEFAAKAIFERIVQDEIVDDMKKQQRLEQAEKIKKEVAMIISEKNAACYSRPSTALTTNSPKYRPPSSPRQISAQTAASMRPGSAFRLTSARIGSSCSSTHVPQSKRVCTKQKDALGTIPLDKYSEFQGLLVTKLNNLNTKSDLTPFANILMTSSDLVRETLDSHRASCARMSSRPGTARSYIKDPRAKYPDKPKDPKYSNIPLDEDLFVRTELDNFDEGFDPRTLEMGTKFYKLYPLAHTPAEMGKPPQNLPKKPVPSLNQTSLATLHLSTSHLHNGQNPKQLRYKPRAIPTTKQQFSQQKESLPTAGQILLAHLNRDTSGLIKMSDLSESKPALLWSEDEAHKQQQGGQSQSATPDMPRPPTSLSRPSHVPPLLVSPQDDATLAEQAADGETSPGEQNKQVRPSTARVPKVMMRRDKPVNPFSGRTVKLGGKLYETVEVMNLKGYGPEDDASQDATH